MKLPTARDRQTIVRTLSVVMGVSALFLGSCSSSHRASPQAPANGSVSTTSISFAPIAYGTITGRYYSEGGPLPGEPPTPVIGTITVTNTKSHETHRPHQDSRGYFTLVVPVGTYDVTARSPNIADAMTRIVTVTAGATVDADLGIVMT